MTFGAKCKPLMFDKPAKSVNLTELVADVDTLKGIVHLLKRQVDRLEAQHKVIDESKLRW